MRHLKIRMIALLLTIIGDELQNLCVSILDDSKKDMNKSIDGIIEYISSPGHSDIDLVRRIRKESQDRERIFADLAEVRKKLYKIKGGVEPRVVGLRTPHFIPLTPN